MGVECAVDSWNIMGDVEQGWLEQYERCGRGASRSATGDRDSHPEATAGRFPLLVEVEEDGHTRAVRTSVRS
jgi:hypothetical protein